MDEKNGFGVALFTDQRAKKMAETVGIAKVCVGSDEKLDLRGRL